MKKGYNMMLHPRYFISYLHCSHTIWPGRIPTTFENLPSWDDWLIYISIQLGSLELTDYPCIVQF